MYSNPGPPVLKVPALPTVPQPLPIKFVLNHLLGTYLRTDQYNEVFWDIPHGYVEKLG